MLPDNARSGDLVLVHKEDDEYFYMYGEIVERTESKVKIMINGRIAIYAPDEIHLAARAGRNLHEEIKEQLESKEPSLLTMEDINDLINLAIDMEEWEWAKDLVNRKQVMSTK
ncbi:hypothetical protein IAQ67_28975 (plasmid) [Paenibacillus peoriae]|uniref:Uncharacterized protein n=1 Tax=Paenibacillus peoriae TaxID=59893 RepID=A0A7H0YH32_9BACL|nr:hypothetical protein [Paenibacillus peoriae]QNR70390.1 hypothetical protein IAQ67_28975 [Paenibacillus peoriae]